MDQNQVTMKARCLCNAHIFTATLPRSSLPLPASACHCTSCRHNTGALCLVDAPWPNENEDLSGLKRYAFSPNTDIFSCGTCSTQMFCRGTHTGDAPIVMTGALDNTPDLVGYDNHIFVGDTVDGGSSTWLIKGPYEKKAKRFAERSNTGHELPTTWPESTVRSSSGTMSKGEASPEFTPLWCHCKGVSLFLRAGKYVSADAAVGLFKKPEEQTGKYITQIDACDSCRLSIGADLVFWVFAPIDHLYYPGEKTENDKPPFQGIQDLRDAVARGDPRIGTLVMYRSSENVERYHCSNCAATFFYTESRRPGRVDIAVGVLEHPDGARAEGLLSWDLGHIGHTSDTKGGWREGLTACFLEEARRST